MADDGFRTQDFLTGPALDFGDWEPRRPDFVVPASPTALELDFTVLDGIGPHRAEALRNRGLLRWSDLWHDLSAVPQMLRGRVLRSIERSYNALSTESVDHFAQVVNRREWWRVAATFPERTVFLDIETTGLSRVYHEITIVGWSKGERFEAVSSENRDNGLNRLRDDLAGSVLITFNGAHFDVPFIRDHMPSVQVPTLHVDLRHLSRRAGLSGGQKDVELRLGVLRPEGLTGVRGDAAPALWFHYQRGSLESLELLLRYNHADVEGMKTILSAVVSSLDPRLTAEFVPSRFELWQSEHGREVITRYSGQVGPRRHLSDLKVDPEVAIVGIDLTGSERRATGWAAVTKGLATTRLIRTDEDILQATIAARPALVSIDAPLSLPRGRTRTTDDDPAFGHGIVRDAERILWSRGVSAYPALIGSMQALTARGITLAARLRSLGIPVIESYPGAKQDILGMPRKGVSLDALKACIVEYGISGNFIHETVTHDEIDAISSAVVGQMFLAGEYEAVGAADEGFMIVPKVGGVPIQRRLVALAGPTAAGKTTLASMLERRGASRARFSETIARQYSASTRDELVAAGAELHEGGQQRLLNASVYEALDESRVCVVDGVRYGEDVAFAREWAGAGATLVYLDADSTVRAQRYSRRSGTSSPQDVADRTAGEWDLPLIKDLATVIYSNDGSIEDLEAFAEQLMEGTS